MKSYENKKDMPMFENKKSSNIFEIIASKDEIEKILNMPGITKEYLEQCKRTAEIYKKPLKS